MIMTERKTKEISYLTESVAAGINHPCNLVPATLLKYTSEYSKLNACFGLVVGIFLLKVKKDFIIFLCINVTTAANNATPAYKYIV